MVSKKAASEEMECRSVRVHFVRTKSYEKAFDDLKYYVDTLELPKTRAALLNSLINEALAEAERSGFKQGFESGRDSASIGFP